MVFTQEEACLRPVWFSSREATQAPYMPSIVREKLPRNANDCKIKDLSKIKEAGNHRNRKAMWSRRFGIKDQYIKS